MLNLPAIIIDLLNPFAPCFYRATTWMKAQTLLIGTILTPGKRVVTEALRVMGMSESRQFAQYHPVLNRAVWSPLALAQVLLKLLVKTCELAYTTLRPDYGYGLISLENQLVSVPGADELSALYNYNFLSPRLVEKLGGRDKVQSVPAWRTVEFDDGGLLLEMSPHPILERKPYTASYLQAAQMLGMSKYYQGGA